MIFFAIQVAVMAQDAVTITVVAGDVALNDTPVAIETDAEGLDEITRICLDSDEDILPGQIEQTEDGSTYVWLQASVPANESREYVLVENGSCPGIQFRWEEGEGRTSDLYAGGTPVLRYVFPQYDPENLEGTIKPFHHVYAPAGDRIITKGPGGLYSHHRGIFFGYNQVRTGGESYDIWHAANGEYSEHQEVVKEWSGPVFGGHQVLIQWMDYDGEPLIEEIRTVRLFRQPDGSNLIDFRTTLESLDGEIELDGDLQHAGVQFRASQYVANNEGLSSYFRTEPWIDYPVDEELQDIEEYVDVPWNVLQYSIEEDDFSVGYIRHSDNPSGGQFSERMYGRFGEFIPTQIDEENSLTLRYRFLIRQGHDVTREQMNSISEGFSVSER